MSHKLFSILALVLTAASLAACNGSQSQANASSGPTLLPATTAEELPIPTAVHATAPVNLAEVVSSPAEPPPQPTTPVFTPTHQPEPTSTPVLTDVIVTKTEDIAGRWYISILAEPTYFEYEPDGTYRAYRAEGGPGSTVQGKIWFEDNVAHIKENFDCEDEGTYEAHLVKANGHNYELYFKSIQDPCRGRPRDMAKKMLWAPPN